ncbi:hypothetical protein GCM10009552_40900 [Rothia nasimurium]|uniref:Uncharacterized protein n=1 Tax=Luteibacter anthropi TaxID=564369 RepID=A0A7X5ZH88_9GAMM|nr:hypothetical protein [Luteibacter anthropi]NII05542.1 hypothetical protein [Luteibacter anthropi]
MFTQKADPQHPAVVGFEIPQLEAKVSHVTDLPVIALLNCEPSTKWVQLFRREVDDIRGKLGLADVKVRGNQVEFFGSISDTRALTEQLKSLIDDVGHKLRQSGKEHPWRSA